MSQNWNPVFRRKRMFICGEHGGSQMCGINRTSLLQTLPPLHKQLRDVRGKGKKKFWPNFWPNVTHQMIHCNADWKRRIAKSTYCQKPVWLMEKEWVAHSYGNIKKIKNQVGKKRIWKKMDCMGSFNAKRLDKWVLRTEKQRKIKKYCFADLLGLTVLFDSKHLSRTHFPVISESHVWVSLYVCKCSLVTIFILLLCASETGWCHQSTLNNLWEVK